MTKLDLPSFLIALTVVLIQSCASVTMTLQDGSAPSKPTQITSHNVHYLFGESVPTISLEKACPGLKEESVTVLWTPSTYIFAIITFGIYQPTKVKIQCIDQDPESSSAEA